MADNIVAEPQAPAFKQTTKNKGEQFKTGLGRLPRLLLLFGTGTAGIAGILPLLPLLFVIHQKLLFGQLHQVAEDSATFPLIIGACLPIIASLALFLFKQPLLGTGSMFLAAIITTKLSSNQYIYMPIITALLFISGFFLLGGKLTEMVLVKVQPKLVWPVLKPGPLNLPLAMRLAKTSRWLTLVGIGSLIIVLAFNPERGNFSVSGWLHNSRFLLFGDYFPVLASGLVALFAIRQTVVPQGRDKQEPEIAKAVPTKSVKAKKLRPIIVALLLQIGAAGAIFYLPTSALTSLWLHCALLFIAAALVSLICLAVSSQ